MKSGFRGFLILIAPDGAYHVPMSFSQVVKVSRAGHRTSHTNMSKLSKTSPKFQMCPTGARIFSTDFELKAHILERLHLSVHLRIAFLLVAM